MPHKGYHGSVQGLGQSNKPDTSAYKQAAESMKSAGISNLSGSTTSNKKGKEAKKIQQTFQDNNNNNNNVDSIVPKPKPKPTKPTNTTNTTNTTSLMEDNNKTLRNTIKKKRMKMSPYLGSVDPNRHKEFNQEMSNAIREYATAKGVQMHGRIINL